LPVSLSVVDSPAAPPAIVISPAPSDASKESIAFSLFVNDIAEIDESENILTQYTIDAQNSTITQDSSTNIENINITIPLPQGASLLITTALYKTGETVYFAGQSVNIPNNGIKYYIRLSNWTFDSPRNSLLITLKTSSNSTNPVSSASQSDGTGNLLWMQTSVGAIILYATFLPYVILDDQIGTVKFQLAADGTSDVQIRVPRFIDCVDIDPNYVVLTNQGSSHSSEVPENSIPIVVVVAVVVPVFAIAMIVLALGLAITYRRRQRRWKALSQKMGALRLSKDLPTTEEVDTPRLNRDPLPLEAAAPTP